jgi:hypothetical protein
MGKVSWSLAPPAMLCAQANAGVNFSGRLLFWFPHD